MTKLEFKKRTLEYERVKLARQELELKIEERLDEVERLKEHIKVQVAKEEEIKQDLKQYSNKGE